MNPELPFDYREARRDLVALLQHIGRRVLRLRAFGKLETQTKDGKNWDLVTEADKLSEQMIFDHLRKRYPDHGIAGEEGADQEGQALFKWYIDPVDGTTNFARGSYMNGISLGLAHHGYPIFGIIHYPGLGDTLIASVGGATEHFYFLGEEVVFTAGSWPVPPAETMKDALVVTNLQVGKEHVFARIRPRVRMASMYNACVFDIRQLVTGQIDAMFHTGATPYDIAAGIVIARQAGCTVSGIFSNEPDLSQKNIPVIFARSKSLCDELRRFLPSVL